MDTPIVPWESPLSHGSGARALVSGESVSGSSCDGTDGMDGTRAAWTVSHSSWSAEPSLSSSNSESESSLVSDSLGRRPGVWTESNRSQCTSKCCVL